MVPRINVCLLTMSIVSRKIDLERKWPSAYADGGTVGWTKAVFDQGDLRVSFPEIRSVSFVGYSGTENHLFQVVIPSCHGRMGCTTASFRLAHNCHGVSPFRVERNRNDYTSSLVDIAFASLVLYYSAKHLCRCRYRRNT